MAKYSHLPVFKATYKLLLRIWLYVDKFDKKHKYTLGEELKKAGLEALKLIILANSAENKYPYLKDLDTQIQILRILARLASDLSALSKKRCEILQREIDEIGRQVGGWLGRSSKGSVSKQQKL